MINGHLGMALKEVWKAGEGISGRCSGGSRCLGRLDQVFKRGMQEGAIVAHDCVGDPVVATHDALVLCGTAGSSGSSLSGAGMESIVRPDW